MENNECISVYRALQKYGLLDMPCPRCGRKMAEEEVKNPISWWAGISVCPDCGDRESAEGNAGEFEDWYAVRLLKNGGTLLNKFSPEGKTPYYTLPIFETVRVTDEEINIIVAMALEGAISNWCSNAEPAGEQLGEELCQQITSGGTILLCDRKSGQDYELTLEKFLKGMQAYLKMHRTDVCENEIDTGKIESLDADYIIQIALFGRVIYD